MRDGGIRSNRPRMGSLAGLFQAAIVDLSNESRSGYRAAKNGGPLPTEGSIFELSEKPQWNRG